MSRKINLVLFWHMHQPYYQDGIHGEYRLPWVYLHGIKDYTDMAWHLENNPKMRCVVNFAPVLLEQIDDYSDQLEAFIKDRQPMRDPLLNILAGSDPIPADVEQRVNLVEICQRANYERMVKPWPAYRRLNKIWKRLDYDTTIPTTDYLDESFYIDMVVWYHLSWMGVSLKKDPRIESLLKQSESFSLAQRKVIIEVIYEAMNGIIPRYRRLAEKGQVELSMTPYGHPIIPLLYDIKAMQETQPHDPLPQHVQYPDGPERARWHMQHGLTVFEHYFGMRPKGVWLSEGGISRDAVALLDEFNIEWTASGEAVWCNSCDKSKGCIPHDNGTIRPLFCSFGLDHLKPRLYFRDDGLSDLIGFEYSSWHADDAVGDFINHITNIAKAHGDDSEEQVVPVILDGENAWESYPENGHHFLDKLYSELSSHPAIEVTTFANLHDQVKQVELSALVPGSWVYGSFSTWIGSEDKNRAWDLLIEAKLAYDKALLSEHLTKEEIEIASQQLAICEGSDWFWWFGDYNPSGSVSDFDILFRQQLKELYRIIKMPAPKTIDSPISSGGGEMENAGTMRRN